VIFLNYKVGLLELRGYIYGFIEEVEGKEGGGLE
jgi:hypothetical protein